LADLAMCDHRAHPRHAALGFARVPRDKPERRRLHRWLDAWRGVGDVVTERPRQGSSCHLGFP